MRSILSNHSDAARTPPCHLARTGKNSCRPSARIVDVVQAAEGPDKEVFFAQQHRPGEAAQTDFTEAVELNVTIAGVAFAHLLCHLVLPYSNWQWVTVCLSESFLALKRGVQDALFQLGRRPEWHQTDNTTSATHKPKEGKREFNDDYADMMKHLGVKPRTIAIGKKEQNGDIESAHRALKRRIDQALLLRGSRDFESEDAYEQWLHGVTDKANRARKDKLAEELRVMAPLDVRRLAEFKEVSATVTGWSTIRVLFNTYSVPSRLIGEEVRVRVYDQRLEVHHAQKKQFEIARLRGRHGHRIDYRHIIWSLVRKPGAFARYRFRDDLFPTPAFRRAYDALYERNPNVRGDLEYLRILHLAAATMEFDVEAALECLLEAGETPTSDAVRALIGDQSESQVPELQIFNVDLDDYDELLGKECAS